VWPLEIFTEFLPQGIWSKVSNLLPYRMATKQDFIDMYFAAEVGPRRSPSERIDNKAECMPHNIMFSPVLIDRFHMFMSIWDTRSILPVLRGPAQMRKN